MAPHARWPGADITNDLRGRFAVYAADWRDGLRAGTRIMAPSTCIFLASLLPALAFGLQLEHDTVGALGVVEVLAATAMAGILQALIGGQPLLIVGVAEPIVIIYSRMYDFASGQPRLGRRLFLPWAAWVCMWTAIMVSALALGGACRAVGAFTRFSGELFGALIGVLFLQQAVKGLVSNFRPNPSAAGSGDAAAAAGPETAAEGFSSETHVWLLVNGLWSLLLATGLLLTSLVVVRARRWRFLRKSLRGLLADYGPPAMVLVWSGMSYIVLYSNGGAAPPGVPRRVATADVWGADGGGGGGSGGGGEPSDADIGWHVTTRMAEVPVSYVAAALVPAFVIAVLFFFDHSVSSLLAQQPEYNLTRPPAYSWDLLLLGGMTLMCGLLGLPPVNGVLPQAPMHTRSLATLGSRLRPAPSGGGGAAAAGTAGSGWGDAGGNEAAIVPQLTSPPLAPAATGGSLASFDGGRSAMANGACPAAETQRSPFGCGGGGAGGGGGSAGAAAVAAAAAAQKAPVQGLGAAAAAAHGSTLPLRVLEQRLSNLLQSMGVAACLFATPAIRQIPQAALWGYFAFMAIESFQGSQLVDRVLLVATDPARRGALLRGAHAPYLETVPYNVAAAFTALQCALLVGLWALVTWAGVAGIAFPLPIMALVPVRRYLLPRFFRPEHLRELDAAEYEQAPPLPPSSQAALPYMELLGPMAAAADVTPAPGGPQVAGLPAAGRIDEEAAGGLDEEAVVDREAEREIIELEHVGVQPVHHLTRGELRQRVRRGSDVAPVPASVGYDDGRGDNGGGGGGAGGGGNNV